MHIKNRLIKWDDPVDPNLKLIEIYCAKTEEASTIYNYSAEHMIVDAGIEKYELPGDFQILKTPGTFIFGVVGVDVLGNRSEPATVETGYLDFSPPEAPTNVLIISE